MPQGVDKDKIGDQRNFQFVAELQVPAEDRL